VQVAEVPSAYASAPEGGAVLDLYPEAFDRDALELELHARALGCFYAAHHGRPTLDACIRTSADSPREVVQAWLWPRLYAADSASREDTTARLAELGIGAVVLHELYFRTTDRAALEAGLEAVLGPRAARSADGGEPLSLWSVPGAVSDPARARGAYAELLRLRSAPPARPLPPPLPPPR
jgi:hypothetical protein